MLSILEILIKKLILKLLFAEIILIILRSTP